MENTRRYRKRDATHRNLMHSAKLLFEEHGISNVTIEQITEKADVSRSTFFSHFSSVDDLLEQIANEELNDILEASHTDGELSVDDLFEKLTQDTYPYPYLMSELLTKSILSSGDSAVAKAFSLINDEIKKEHYEIIEHGFASKDVTAFIFGAYFGLIFQKIIGGEKFEKPEETNLKIKKFIQYIKNQEEITNE